MTKYRIPSTDYQSKIEVSPTIYEAESYRMIWSEYINTSYLDNLMIQDVTPVLLFTMPVIIIAALMMASFMINWTMRSASELGILGAIGANRRSLCSIAVGQILLLSLIAAVPTVIISAALSNYYISALNSTLSDIYAIFAVPWLRLIQASLYFTLFSCLFTYAGISRLTSSPPFTLIGGSYRSKLPFVRRSSKKLEKARDKVRHISLVRAFREIKSQAIPAVITSLICIVCAFFVIFMALNYLITAGIIESSSGNAFDGAISVDSSNATVYNRTAELDETTVEYLAKTGGFSQIGRYTFLGAQVDYTYISGGIKAVFADDDSGGHTSEYFNSAACDEVALPLLYSGVCDGDPADLFIDDESVIIVIDNYSDGSLYYRAGDKIMLTASRSSSAAQLEFKIAAVVTGSSNAAEDVSATDSRSIILSHGSAARLGAEKISVSYSKATPYSPS